MRLPTFFTGRMNAAHLNNFFTHKWVFVMWGLRSQDEEERRRYLEAAERQYEEERAFEYETNRPGGFREKPKEAIMANKVTAQIVGGASQTFDNVSTVGDVAAKLGAGDRTATVNGEPASHGDLLNDYEFVVFADKKKGGKK